MRRFLVLAGCAALCSCQAPLPAVKGDAATGQVSYRGYCAACHNPDSRQRKVGPGLKGLFQWDQTSNGKPPTEANIRAKIDKGGNGMPAFKDLLSGLEMDDLIAYLRTL
jgi:mono/diheme cytochrome c family protein